MDLHKIYQKAQEFVNALNDIDTVGEFADIVNSNFACGIPIDHYEITYSHYIITSAVVDDAHDEIWEDGYEENFECIDDLDEAPYSNSDKIGFAKIYLDGDDTFKELILDNQGLKFTIEDKDGETYEEICLEEITNQLVAGAVYTTDFYDEESGRCDLKTLQEAFAPAFDNLHTDLLYTAEQLENILYAYTIVGQDLADELCDVQISEEVSSIVINAVGRYPNTKSLDDIKEYLSENNFNSLSEIEVKKDIEAFEDWCWRSKDTTQPMNTFDKSNVKKEGVQAKANITKE